MAEKEYIEREAALRDWPLCDEPGDAYQFIRNFPAADVRPVVLCRDCKYNTREVIDLWGQEAYQCITGTTHRKDWFCADGERREES